MTASPPSADQSADIDPAVVEYAVTRRWGKPSARQTVAILLCGLILAAGLSLAVHFVDALTAVPSQPDYGVPPNYDPRSHMATGRSATGVEPPPLIFKPLAAPDARAINAAQPFSTAPRPPAPPFIYSGSADNWRRAQECLASAAYYEAGDDPVGQRAVAQVVVNRVRHPAFPKSVCGVVFQGSERAIGCQFTFTCDGSIVRRRPSASAWSRALIAAKAALNGYVFGAVSTATHYHTDYVVPYWSAQMDKLVMVRGHIFFRWSHAGMLRRVSMSDEPVIASIASLSGDPKKEDGPSSILSYDLAKMGDWRDRSSVANGADGKDAGADVPAWILKGSRLHDAAPAAGAYLLSLEPGAFAGSYAVTAYRMCRDKPECTVIGWLNPGDLPSGSVISAAAARTMSFFYRVDGDRRKETVLFDCAVIDRPDPRQCLPDNRMGLLPK